MNDNLVFPALKAKARDALALSTGIKMANSTVFGIATNFPLTGDYHNDVRGHYDLAVRLTAERDALQQRLNSTDEEIDRLRSALDYYARKDHYHFEFPDGWDSVSGEPVNILWHEDHGYVEDGSIAKKALEGKQ